MPLLKATCFAGCRKGPGLIILIQYLRHIIEYAISYKLFLKRELLMRLELLIEGVAASHLNTSENFIIPIYVIIRILPIILQPILFDCLSSPLSFTVCL